MDGGGGGVGWGGVGVRGKNKERGQSIITHVPTHNRKSYITECVSSMRCT